MPDANLRFKLVPEYTSGMAGAVGGSAGAGENKTEKHLKKMSDVMTGMLKPALALFLTGKGGLLSGLGGIGTTITGALGGALATGWKGLAIVLTGAWTTLSGILATAWTGLTAALSALFLNPMTWSVLGSVAGLAAVGYLGGKVVKSGVETASNLMITGNVPEKEKANPFAAMMQAGSDLYKLIFGKPKAVLTIEEQKKVAAGFALLGITIDVNDATEKEIDITGELVDAKGVLYDASNDELDMMYMLTGSRWEQVDVTNQLTTSSDAAATSVKNLYAAIDRQAASAKSASSGYTGTGGVAGQKAYDTAAAYRGGNTSAFTQAGYSSQDIGGGWTKWSPA